MSAHNFWNNLTHGFMHGMFGNSPFFGCSWGGWGCNISFNSCFTPMFSSNYLVPNVFSTMNFNSLMPEMSLPSLPNVSIDVNELFPTDNWMESAFNNSNFNSNISNTFNNVTNNTNTIFQTNNWLKPINSNYSFSFDTFIKQSQVTPKKETTRSQNISNSSVKPAKMTGNSVNDKYFDKMLSHILGSESGYANHPNDKGGETNRGVTKETYNNYRRRKGLPTQSVRYITDAEVKDIYYEIFVECGADKIDNPQVAFMVFDVSVNSGATIGKKMFRECGGDFNKMEQWRRNHYANLVKKDPSQKDFIKGWNNRVTNAMNFAKNNLPDRVTA